MKYTICKYLYLPIPTYLFTHSPNPHPRTTLHYRKPTNGRFDDCVQKVLDNFQAKDAAVNRRKSGNKQNRRDHNKFEFATQNKIHVFFLHDNLGSLFLASINFYDSFPLKSRKSRKYPRRLVRIRQAALIEEQKRNPLDYLTVTEHLNLQTFRKFVEQFYNVGLFMQKENHAKKMADFTCHFFFSRFNSFASLTTD